MTLANKGPLIIGKYFFTNGCNITNVTFYICIMRIVFMGTPGFAIPSLDILLKNNYKIVAVVTAPDKPAGRGQKLQESEVKKYAISKGLSVLQPENLKAPDFIEKLKLLNADLQIVVAFRMLPEAVWNMPRLGTYNLHASLLPKYRGAAPINWAIINGEKETGVTTFKLQHEIDTGTVLFQEKVSISETETAGELHDRLMHIGADLILKSVKAIETNTILLTEQDETKAIHAPKLFKETCKINWNESTTTIFNLIRGLSPYPAAYSGFRDRDKPAQNLKIYSCSKEISSHNHTNGLIITDNKTYIKCACRDGFIIIHELQLQGKKRMKTEDFLRGYKFPEYTVLK